MNQKHKLCAVKPTQCSERPKMFWGQFSGVVQLNRQIQTLADHICSALLYFILNFSIVCCDNFVLIVRLGSETKPTGFGIRKYCFSSTNTSGKHPNVSELWSRPLHMWHKLERISRLQKHKITNISCKNVPFSQLMLPRKRHFLTSNSSLFCTNLHNSRQK